MSKNETFCEEGGAIESSPLEKNGLKYLKPQNIKRLSKLHHWPKVREFLELAKLLPPSPLKFLTGHSVASWEWLFPMICC